MLIVKEMKLKRFIRWSACVLLAGTLAGCNVNRDDNMDQRIPLEDFFRNPEKSAFKISPRGSYLSFKAPYRNRMNIYIQKVGEEDTVRLTSETDRDIAAYFWPNDRQILYLKDDGGDENWKLYSVNADGSGLRCFTDFDNVVTRIIEDLPDIEDEVIIAMNKRKPQIFDPYRLNINTGEMKMLAENPGNIQEWIFDHDGRLRVATAIVDGVNTQVLYRDTEEDEFRPVLTTSFRETVNIAFFTFDNQNVYALSNLGRDKVAAVLFDIRSGKEKEVIYEQPDYDISGLYFSREREVLTSASYQSYKRERHFFDPESERIFRDISSKLEGYDFGFTGHTRDEEKFIVRTYSDRSLGSYYLYEKTKNQLEWITDVSPWIDEERMASVYPVSYQSRDGLTIHGYLTLPKGMDLSTARGLPVIIHPHGGPWVRDSWGFNPEIQFLANRGFAILQMNYRGSTGYGRSFWEAGFKQWGRAMQDDITDGVRWLISEGIADEGRIGIYGGSYGGYATLMGVVKTPGLYAAAVDYVGVSNLFTFMESIPPYWEPYLEMMYEMVGHPEKDSAMLAENSPALHADRIITPLFIAQGANDPRVKKAESDQIVKALRERGVEVEYLVKEDEGHGFRNEENRFEFYRKMEKFLEEHLFFRP